jgi:hypothetical protein
MPHLQSRSVNSGPAQIAQRLQAAGCRPATPNNIHAAHPDLVPSSFYTCPVCTAWLFFAVDPFGGRDPVYLACQNGCTEGAILAALGLTSGPTIRGGADA